MIQETPRSRGDPGSFSARCIAPSTLHLGLTSHAKDELVGLVQRGIEPAISGL
ncbi:hypothetical protein DPMN_125122 [Dreissena polymorpha]|uniref:Uncharacterized protein n=1 Tax=Dreissena polymorpha TaxID=45954 RepID=A0A9D4JUE8_DREPO|nr:hypothetical protein DPMN_125122 [Dreissena polymorpha]